MNRTAAGESNSGSLGSFDALAVAAIKHKRVRYNSVLGVEAVRDLSWSNAAIGLELDLDRVSLAINENPPALSSDKVEKMRSRIGFV